ncbi:hypothetical protein B0H13DRAFT_1624931 [Mycena leptocephala]|nr:hypothetical protein B0H13DRAFT_1624931 [Mycena leptocephala]
MLQEPDSPTYEVRQCATEQMGLGMFATHNLKPGELILSERPALVYPGRFRSSTDELENLFSVALDEISVDEDRVAYRKFSKGLNKTPRVGDLVRIATANCFQLPPNPPGGPNERWTIGDYRAVYLISSRINHSCSPNTVADFDLLSFSMVVRAARDIKQGGEISTAYIALHSPKAHRKTLLAFCMPSSASNTHFTKLLSVTYQLLI